MPTLLDHFLPFSHFKPVDGTAAEQRAAMAHNHAQRAHIAQIAHHWALAGALAVLLGLVMQAQGWDGWKLLIVAGLLGAWSMAVTLALTWWALLLAKREADKHNAP